MPCQISHLWHMPCTHTRRPPLTVPSWLRDRYSTTFSCSSGMTRGSFSTSHSLQSRRGWDKLNAVDGFGLLALHVDVAAHVSSELAPPHEV